MNETAQTVVALAAGVVALGILWRYLVRPFWRFLRWLSDEIKDEIERRKAIDRLLERELTANGGGSMKDQMAQTVVQVDRLGNQIKDVVVTQDVTLKVLDRIIERRALDGQAFRDLASTVLEQGDLRDLIRDVDRRDGVADRRES